LAGATVFDPAIAPDPSTLERHRALLDAREFDDATQRPRVALALDVHDVNDPTTFELLGLGLALRDGGAGVVVLDPKVPTAPAGTEVVLCDPRGHSPFDPSADASLPRLMMWTHSLPRQWLRTHGLEWFDVVLAGSERSREEVSRYFSGATLVLPHGVDTSVFQAPVDRTPARRGFVSAVQQTDGHRPLVDAFGAARFSAPLAILDRAQTYPRALRRFVKGHASPAERAASYQRADLAFSAPGVDEPADALEQAAIEALACGADVLTNADLSAYGLQVPPVPAGAPLGPLVERGPRERDAITHDAHVVTGRHSLRARAEIVAGVIAAPEARGDFGIVAYFPNYWHQPYLRYLYAGLRPRGMRAVPVAGPPVVLERPALRSRPKVFHLQWTQLILSGASSADDARRRADRYIDELKHLRAEGVPVIWTMHNVLPHECAHPGAERHLRAGIGDVADVVHVLNRHVLDATADLYPIPDSKVVVIPEQREPVHATVSASQARSLLGLAADKTTYLAFGRIRPYKELDRLLDGFAVHHAAHPDTQLLVAGALERFPGSAALGRRCLTEPGVVARLGQTPEAEVELLFAATDFTVIGYRKVSNSGVAIQSIAHGCPVLAPRVGGLPEVVADGGLLFDPDEDLSVALGAAYDAARNAATREHARALGDTRSAAAMAREFTAIVENLMG
jgi:glycosyltransferase involved in cell wall biosynthesis